MLHAVSDNSLIISFFSIIIASRNEGMIMEKIAAINSAIVTIAGKIIFKKNPPDCLTASAIE